MKSLALTTILAAAVAYTGSFLNVWTLPHQKRPYTIENMKPAADQVFGFTNDLRNTRNERVEESEALFANRGRSLRSFDAPKIRP